ncbi:MAG: PaaI family thioesterase [Spirochaetaceae bacterium]|nr:PaaI family thioesterase [Spirochaetaceae bacterium]
MEKEVYLKKLREHFANDKYASESTDCVIEDADENYAKCSFIISEKHQNAVHGVMGGAIFTLADFTFAVAVNGLKKEEITVSLVSQISFLSSPKGSKLIAEAHCIKQGRSTSCYEISISDDTNRRIALVTFTGFSKN